MVDRDGDDFTAGDDFVCEDLRVTVLREAGEADFTVRDEEREAAGVERRTVVLRLTAPVDRCVLRVAERLLTAGVVLRMLVAGLLLMAFDDRPEAERLFTAGVVLRVLVADLLLMVAADLSEEVRSRTASADFLALVLPVVAAALPVVRALFRLSTVVPVLRALVAVRLLTSEDDLPASLRTALWSIRVADEALTRAETGIAALLLRSFRPVLVRTYNSSPCFRSSGRE